MLKARDNYDLMMEAIKKMAYDRVSKNVIESSVPKLSESKFANGLDIGDEGSPKKKTKIIVALESGYNPTYYIGDNNIPNELKALNSEYTKLVEERLQISRTIDWKNIPKDELEEKVNKMRSVDERIKKVNNEFNTSKYNTPIRNEFFKEQGDLLKTKLNQYYPDVDVDIEMVYKDNFNELLEKIKKDKDSKKNVKTILINHSDNHEDKAFGLPEQDVYGKIAELGSDIYCGNCQDETQHEVLQKVASGVNAYYPDFIPLKDRYQHRTWGGVNKYAKKGKDIDETLQRLMYTIHDDSNEDIGGERTYKTGQPMFKKTGNINNISKSISDVPKMSRGGIVKYDYSKVINKSNVPMSIIFDILTKYNNEDHVKNLDAFIKK